MVTAIKLLVIAPENDKIIVPVIAPENDRIIVPVVAPENDRTIVPVIAPENDIIIVPVKVYQILVARRPLDSGLTGRLCLAPCLHVVLSEGNKSKCSPTVINVLDLFFPGGISRSKSPRQQWPFITVNKLRTADSKIHGANMGLIWGRQDPGGPHVCPMNFAIWDIFVIYFKKCM